MHLVPVDIPSLDKQLKLYSHFHSKSVYEKSKTSKEAC